jgi:hypothetical protein
MSIFLSSRGHTSNGRHERNVYSGIHHVLSICYVCVRARLRALGRKETATALEFEIGIPVCLSGVVAVSGGPGVV